MKMGNKAFNANNHKHVEERKINNDEQQLIVKGKRLATFESFPFTTKFYKSCPLVSNVNADQLIATFE